MDDQQPEQEKRWFRVVEACPSYRLVDIQATSGWNAQEIADSLRDDQFFHTEEDGWLLESLTEIPEEDVMNPLE